MHRESELLPALAVLPPPDLLAGTGTGKPRRPAPAPPAAKALAPSGTPHAPVYTLAMCTASNRANRAQVVEWLEYHRLVRGGSVLVPHPPRPPARP